jgi:hypothetical protein
MMRCEESLETECPGMWYEEENKCLREKDTNCALEHCEFCVKVTQRSFHGDGFGEEEKDECLSCSEGYRVNQEHLNCEVDTGPDMEARLAHCPPLAEFAECSLCATANIRVGEDEYDVEEYTFCAACNDYTKFPVRGECLTDPLTGAFDCTTDEKHPGCSMCRNQVVFRPDWTYCVECQTGWNMDEKEGESFEVKPLGDCPTAEPWTMDGDNTTCVSFCPANTHQDPSSMTCKFNDYCEVEEILTGGEILRVCNCPEGMDMVGTPSECQCNETGMVWNKHEWKC